MSSGDESSGEEEEEFREDMRVFLRLRPMNKLEQSRRSKNCIELHEDTTVITVDSPLEGEYDFVFDHVSILPFILPDREKVVFYIANAVF